MAKAWINFTNYVDVETGVLIGKKEFKEKYIEIKKTIRIRYEGRTNIRTKTVECRKRSSLPQLRLFE